MVPTPRLGKTSPSGNQPLSRPLHGHVRRGTTMPGPPAADDFFPLPEEYSEEPQPLSEQQARMLTALFRSKPEVWLSVEQLSGRLGIPVNTLRAWRRQGHGPKG